MEDLVPISGLEDDIVYRENSELVIKVGETICKDTVFSQLSLY